MSNIIEPLLELQTLDTEIHRVQLDLETVPAALREREEQLAEQKKDWEAQIEKIKKLKVDLHFKEVDLQKYTDRVEEVTERQKLASSAKEFAAFASEIASAKADSSRLEDQVLKEMEVIQGEEEIAATLEGGWKEIADTIDADRVGVDDELARLNEELGKHMARRDEVAGSIDPELLNEYNRILNSRDSGKVITEADGRNCLNCGASLSPQIINTLLLGKEVVICKSCWHILHIADKAAVLKKS